MFLYERIASAVVGTPLQRPAEGLRWLTHLPQRLKHPELREIYLEGKRIEQVLEAVITTGMNCVDVGAHLGSVLQRIVRLSPVGQHLAIEPLEYKAAWLRRKFPKVTVYSIAVGDTNGAAPFFYDVHRSAFSALQHGADSGSRRVINVECKRLDDVVPKDRKIGFIKIDVEGGEYAAFQGAGKLLARDRPCMLFESTLSGLANFGCTAADLYALLTREFDYQIYLIKDWLSGSKPLSLNAFETSMTFPFAAFNYVAAPRG